MPVYDCSDSCKLRLSDIPAAPGVYIFRDSANEVLYVGKARDLRKRLASYLRKGSGVPARTAIMIGHARTFEVIVTPSEKEALILEATLIKRHRPRYNIVFRDDKAYPFLRISTGETWPRISIVRSRRRDSAEYFGPYPSSGALRETIRLITTTFGIRTCTNRAMKNRSRACLQYQIGKCSGPCVGAVSSQEYRQKVRQVLDFFAGKSSNVIKQIREDMHQAAEALEFERAARLRDRITALQKVLERQSVVSKLHASWDCIGFHSHSGNASVAVLRIREGMVTGCETRRISLQTQEPAAEVLKAFMLSYYQDAAPAREILVPELPKDAQWIVQWLSQLWNYRVGISIPERGDRKRLLAMAQENARQDVEQTEIRRRRWKGIADAIASTLELSRPPISMECIDISTTGGELPVGSLVAFRYGEAWKQGYRIYNINGIEGMDDFAMIHQVVSRRMERAREKGDLPDILLIDGGRGQLSAAIDAVNQLDAECGMQVISIAKERKGEGEKIYVHGRKTPLMLSSTDPVLLFFQRMRDEAHRFGITAHRRRRDRRRSISGLSDIPGVGPARQKLLLETFGSMDGVYRASLHTLQSVKGIPADVANRIYDFLHGKDT